MISIYILTYQLILCGCALNPTANCENLANITLLSSITPDLPTAFCGGALRPERIEPTVTATVPVTHLHQIFAITPAAYRAFCGGAVWISFYKTVTVALFSIWYLISHCCTCLQPSWLTTTLTVHFWHHRITPIAILAFCGGATVRYIQVSSHRPFCSGGAGTLAPQVQLAFCGGAQRTYHQHILRRPNLHRFLRHWVLHWFCIFRIYLHNVLLLANTALELCVDFSADLYNSIQFCNLGTFHQFARLRILSASSPNNTSDRHPGPKSGHSNRQHFSRTLLVFLLLFTSFHLQRWSEGEGHGSAMGSVEAPEVWEQALINTVGAKRHGTGPTMCYGTSKRPMISPVVKRSLRRAQRRIQTQGMAWYRGKCYTRKDFQELWPGIASNLPPPSSLRDTTNPDLHACSRTHSPRKRTNFFVWNCGGLSIPRFDEVRTWVYHNNIGMGILIETRWQYTSEWCDEYWSYVHTGDPNNKGQGILVMTAKTLCAPDLLKWRDILPGRLLHVRIPCGDRHMDVLACYQHTYKQTMACQRDRDSWWQCLDETLHQLPQRNTLALLGDFNCCLPYSQSITGTAEFRWQGTLIKGTQHADQGRFISILKTYGITTLNTWRSDLGPTYVHQEQASRIDFVCTRLHSANGATKDIRYLWELPFLDQTHTGHAPILFSFAKIWTPPGSNMKFKLTAQQKLHARQAYEANSMTWQQFTEASAVDIACSLQHAEPAEHDPLADMHAKLMTTFKTFFPAAPCKRTAAPWERTETLVLTKWDHRRAFLAPKLIKLDSVFRMWFHVASFLRLKKAHRRLAYTARLQRFDEMAMNASVAADRHDMHTMFKLINANSPKQPRKRLQLRNSNGTIANPVEATAIMTHYVSSTWQGPATVGYQFDCAPGVPFSVDELALAFSRIPLNKSVAPIFIPGVAWRPHAQMLAELLHKCLETWWSTAKPYIPASWKAGWLVMIPKPVKAPTHPSNLRPLVLQDPIGKSIIGILIHHALTQARGSLIQWPIFAYMPARSTMDSIVRVAIHCKQVRALVSSQRPSPHHRAHHVPKYKICGGLQIYLDIERAFDAVSRSKLFTKLHDLHVSPAVTSLLAAWHESTVYHVQTELGNHPIQTGRGLRQGCKAAPTLWNFFVMHFLTELCNHLPVEWIREHLTVYADDCHIGAMFWSATDFHTLMHAIGIIFSTLKSLDMTVNPTKTMTLLSMSGTSHRPFRQRVVHRDQQGEFVKIDIPGDSEMKLRLHSSANYLGVKLSYKQFEQDTVRHRIKLARIGFSRLRHWLCGRQLCLQRRFHLWKTCIYPILSYGLFAMTHTQHTILQIQQVMFGMLRRVLHDHSFQTHHTHFHALQLHNIPTPLQLLKRTAERLRQSDAQRRQTLPPQDLLHTQDWTHLDDLIRLLDMLQETNSSGSPSTQVVEACSLGPVFQCSHCDFYTSNISVFRRHCTISHRQTMHRTQFALAHGYALNGLPTCKLCHQSFTTWRSFQNHLERGCQVKQAGPCSCVPDTAAPAFTGITEPGFMPPSTDASRGLRLLTDAEMRPFLQHSFGPRIIGIMQERTWHRIARERDACQFLKERCFLCNTHCSRLQDLNAHYRQQHPDLWTGVTEKAVVLTNLYACDEAPCDCCGSLFRNHTCPVFVQLAVMLLHGAALDEPCIEDQQLMRLRCDICMELFPNSALLSQHLQQAHDLQGLNFNESRDVMPGTTACTHCGMNFHTVDGVKSHVVQGRCLHYDPRATAETLEMKDTWTQACLEGQLHQILKPPMTRLHLTLHCQMCGKVYRRAADLAAHLMGSHSRLWRQAQRLTLLLVGLIYGPGQCCCNPSIGHKRSSHVCIPLRQLAMCYHRMGLQPFAPFPITDDVLANLFSPDLSRERRFSLERALANRQFALLWQDADLIHCLSTTCLQCGQLHAAADLCLHLREAHILSHPMLTFYMEQFVAMMHHQNELDHQCSFCVLIFNLPARVVSQPDASARYALAESHFKGQCPYTLQLAWIFACLLNGRRLGHDTIRADFSRSDLGDLPEPQAHVGPHLEAGIKPEITEAPKAKRKAARQSRPTTANRTAKRSCPTTPAPTDHPGHPTRPGDQLAAKKRLFCHVLLPQAGGSSHLAVEGDAELASDRGGPGQHLTQDAATTTTPEMHADGDAQSHQPHSKGLGQRPSVLGVGEERLDPPRQVLAIPPVELPDQGSDAQLSPGDLHGQDVGACHRAPRDGMSPGSDNEVQRLAGGRGQPCRPVAPADLSACRRPSPTSGSVVQQLCMVHPGHQLEGPQPESMRPGHEPADTAGQQTTEGTRQRQVVGQDQNGDLKGATAATLIWALMGLRLQNVGNWCYANSSTYCIFWALLCQHVFDPNDWGNHFADLSDFLCRHADTPASLVDEHWFQQMLTSWGFTLEQQDCSEFLHAMLTWLQLPTVDMRWERKVDVEAAIEIHDTNSQYMPIKLQFTTAQLAEQTCTLQALVNSWCQVDGMTTALKCAPQILCVHLDRLYSDAAANLARHECSVELEAEITFPFYVSPGLDLSTAGYVIVAAAAHFGHDLAGHYRVALKTQPTVLSEVQPVRWLLTEDCQRPTATWQLPEWFVRRTTTFLLVRTDCLRLPTCRRLLHEQHQPMMPADINQRDTSDIESAQAILALLPTQLQHGMENHVLPKEPKADFDHTE